MYPIGRLLGLRYKSHSWHGVDTRPDAPENVMCFIEMVPTDTVKYEVDKVTGYLRFDRPQKYSNVVPAFYGFMPQAYSGKKVAEFAMQKSDLKNIKGDGDPIDICILTEKEIALGAILVRAMPFGGFRMIDGDEADEKLIAVLSNDAFYGNFKDISDLPDLVIGRLKHYFLTYKYLPGNKAETQITDTYGVAEAHEVIERLIEDYHNKFSSLDQIISSATQ